MQKLTKEGNEIIFTCVTPMLLDQAKTYRLRYRSEREKQSRVPNNPIEAATGRAASRYVLFLEGDNIRNRLERKMRRSYLYNHTVCLVRLFRGFA